LIRLAANLIVRPFSTLLPLAAIAKYMRKYILILLAVTAYSGANAQQWVDVGIKGEFGANVLFNSNIFKDKTFNHKLTGGFGFGGKLGFNLSEFHEITFDVIYSSYRQRFSFNRNVDSTSTAEPLFEKSFRFASVDLIPMYRFNREGRYLEIGPQFSLIGANSVSGSSDYPYYFAPVDLSSYFNRTQIGAVFGAGNYFVGTDNFGITFGVRFKYMFTDLFTEAGKNANYPSETVYDTYKASHAFSAMLVMEANYDLGYLAKAKCGQRKKILFF
jgi:hypothetical protein